MKKIINLSVANSYMVSNPFAAYKVDREPVEKDFLNEVLQCKGNKAVRLIKNKFRVGGKYTNESIAKGLSKIFAELNIHPEKQIRPATILDYYQAVEWRDAKKRGYLLVNEIV